MPLHRRVTIAAFSADPYWSRTQANPAPAGLVETIRANKPVKITWWGVGYDGGDQNARPVDSTGLSFDAALVYKQGGSLAPEYIRLSSIVEETTAQLEAGRAAVEVDLPEGCEAWLQVIAITNTSAATHLWLSYHVRQEP